MRVKRAVHARKRKNSLFKAAKGYRGGRSRLLRELTVPNSLINNFAEQQAHGKTAYTRLVQNLSQEAKQSGKIWLKAITANVRNIFVEEINKGK
jgi:ribosomal protein L20